MISSLVAGKVVPMPTLPLLMSTLAMFPVSDTLMPSIPPAMRATWSVPERVMPVSISLLKLYCGVPFAAPSRRGFVPMFPNVHVFGEPVEPPILPAVVVIAITYLPLTTTLKELLSIARISIFSPSPKNMLVVLVSLSKYKSPVKLTSPTTSNALLGPVVPMPTL